MIIFSGHDRLYTVPGGTGQQITGWDALGLAQDGNDWANSIIAGLSPQELPDDGTEYFSELPPEDEDVIRKLFRSAGGDAYEVWTPEGWARSDAEAEVMDLDNDLASALYDALVSGASGLALRYFDPIAWLPPSNDDAAVPVTAAMPTGEDTAWHMFAVVDELDHGAVLNVIRMAPGPELEAYVGGGEWKEDPKLLADLRGVTPPLLVEIADEKLDDVLRQVDDFYAENPIKEDANPEATTAAGPSAAVREKAAKDGTALKDGSFPIRNKADLRKAVHAFGRAKNKDRAKRHIIKRARALNAVDMLPEDWRKPVRGSALSPLPGVSPDPRAERLRRYWSIGGKGGLKIKWGLPGDWKRCVRYLSKYMGVRAKGYCQLMHKRNTGVYTGSKLNASVLPAIEEALSAALAVKLWRNEDGKGTDMQDGIYTEVVDSEAALVESLLAAAFPVAPPDEWFEDPKLEGPTPIQIGDDGRVKGHIATFDIAHIGMPGNVRAPRSKSQYAYFHTGDLVTASGKHIGVGQLTLAGGHAPLHADAGQAVKHYDDTASAIVDMRVGEDRFGIWAAGAVRPEATPEQLRALRASAPSGDWRPINGSLELVAVCQVNVPGFPVARARVASGAVCALVAAGARPLAEQRFAERADEALSLRVTRLEALAASAENDGEYSDEDDFEPLVEEENSDNSDNDKEDTPDEDVNRDKIAAIRERIRQKKREELRQRVHPAEAVAAEETAKPVAASARQALRDRVHSR